MTLREKRHREVTNTLNRTVAQRDGCLANLVRYETRIKSLRRQAQRLERAMAQPVTAKPLPVPQPVAPAPAPLTPQQVADVKESRDALDKAIPDFLARKRSADQRDKIARQAIEAEQAERKKNKARVRIETMKAKQRGDTKRMPLSGRAALAAINAGP